MENKSKKFKKALPLANCCGIIVFSDAKGNEVCLVRQDTRGDRTNHGFPKGGRNPDESELEGAYRELNEETGLTRDDVELVAVDNKDGQASTEYVTVDEISPKGHLAVRYFLGIVRASTRADFADKRRAFKFSPDEIDEVRWAPFVEVHKLVKPSRQAVLTAARSRLLQVKGQEEHEKKKEKSQDSMPTSDCRRADDKNNDTQGPMTETPRAACGDSKITSSATAAEVSTTLMDTGRSRWLSKTLSWLLRHGAASVGLSLDAEGYASLKDVLKVPQIKKDKVTATEVKYVVDHNDKQRFAWKEGNKGQVLIRANQGHSGAQSADAKLNDEKMFKRLTTPLPVCVHGTTRKAWSKIVQDGGLRPMQRAHIHLAKGLPGDEGVVSGMRRGAAIHVYVDMARAMDDGIVFYESDNGVVLTRGNKDGLLSANYLSIEG